MSFWLHDGYCKRVTKKISTQNRFYISIFIITTFLLVWFVFLLRPLSINVGSQQQENTLLNFDIQKKLEFIESSKAIKSEHNYLLQFVEKNMHNNSSVQMRIDFILQKLKNLNLSCKSLSPEEVDTNIFFTTYFFSMSIKGRFESLVAFLEVLDNFLFDYTFISYDIIRWKKGDVKMDATFAITDIIRT